MLYDKGHLPIKGEFQYMAITRNTSACGMSISEPRCRVSTEEFDESES